MHLKFNSRQKKALRHKSFNLNFDKVKADTKRYKNELRRTPKVSVKQDDESVVKINSICIGPEVVPKVDDNTVTKKDEHDEALRKIFYCTSCTMVTHSNPSSSIKGIFDHYNKDHPEHDATIWPDVSRLAKTFTLVQQFYSF